MKNEYANPVGVIERNPLLSVFPPYV